MPAEANSPSNIIQYGTFTLDSQLFAVDILRMREIIRPPAITKVPKAEEYMTGVINLRGQVIPVISLRSKFGMPTKPVNREARIINVDVDGVVVGFIVDSIEHVHKFSQDSIEAPPAVTTSVDSEYISGVVSNNGQLLIILNVDKLVSADVLEAAMQG